MGRDTIQFRCHHCNHCCTEVVCLPTPWDVRRIIKMTGADPYEFLEFLTMDEIEDVPKSDPTWLKCGGERYIMALERGKKGCFFLNKSTKLCTIYEARPILCRMYPFRVHEKRDGTFKKFTLHEDVGCPKHRDGTIPTAPLYKMYLEDDEHQDAYHILVDLFNERKYEGKCPEDFVELFTLGAEHKPGRAHMYAG